MRSANSNNPNVKRLNIKPPKEERDQLEKKCKELEARCKELKQENIKLKDDCRELKKRLLFSLRTDADNAEAEIAYSRLFGEIGLAIQKLFALAKEEEEREGYERILEEEIQAPIKEAFRIYQVIIRTDSEIFLPIGEMEAEPGLIERLEQLSASDLDKAIKECEGRIKRAKVYEIPKGAVNRAAGSLRCLTETPTAELDWQKLKELSGAIEKAFDESGIYPLYRRNKRVLERPDLCSLFIEVKGNELIWPGLFTKTDNKLQMYGNFQGTCRRGEWDNEGE